MIRIKSTLRCGSNHLLFSNLVARYLIFYCSIVSGTISGSQRITSSLVPDLYTLGPPVTSQSYANHIALSVLQSVQDEVPPGLS